MVPWSAIDHATLDMPAIAFGPVRSEVMVWKKDAASPLATQASERVPNAQVMLDVIALAVEAET